MKKFSARFVMFLGLVSFTFFQGCASNQSLVKSDQALLSSVKCVRVETPPIMKKTAAGTYLLAAVAIATPGGSALMALNDKIAEESGDKMQQSIPDFGVLVIDKFSEKLSKDGTLAKSVTVESKPVPDERIVPAMPGQPAVEKSEETCTVLRVKVKQIVYGYVSPFKGSGFETDTVAKITSPEGKLIWEKEYTYFSKDFNRTKELAEYEAGGGQLLRQELEFAADQTALAFFADLNSGIKR